MYANRGENYRLSGKKIGHLSRVREVGVSFRVRKVGQITNYSKLKLHEYRITAIEITPNFFYSKFALISILKLFFFFRFILQQKKML